MSFEKPFYKIKWLITKAGIEASKKPKIKPRYALPKTSIAPNKTPRNIPAKNETNTFRMWQGR